MLGLQVSQFVLVKRPTIYFREKMEGFVFMETLVVSIDCTFFYLKNFFPFYEQLHINLLVFLEYLNLPILLSFRNKDLLIFKFMM